MIKTITIRVVNGENDSFEVYVESNEMRIDEAVGIIEIAKFNLLESTKSKP